jgi:hypothetical protein
VQTPDGDIPASGPDPATVKNHQFSCVLFPYGFGSSGKLVLLISIVKKLFHANS